MASQPNATAANNTPQAVDDQASATENQPISIDVLANDRGGAAKSLYSINQNNLLTPATTGTSNMGAALTIQNGKITYSPNGPAFEALAAGQKATDAFTYAIQLGNGAISRATVTVALTGVNEAPVVVGTSSTTSETIAELPNATGSNTADNTSGSIAFADPDLTDTHKATSSFAGAIWSGGAVSGTVQQELAQAFSVAISKDSTEGATGIVGWSFSLPDSDFDFLAQGEQLTATYDVVVGDGNGGTVAEPVTVTITGANDAPVMAADAGPHALTEMAGKTGDTTDQDATSGTLSFTDADLSDKHTVAASLSSTSWSGGSTIPSETLTALAGAVSAAVAADSAGSGSGKVGWSFSVPDQTFDFLAAGETLNATYNVSVSDAQGASSIQPVTISVTGTNDPPITVPDNAPVLEADAGPHALTEIAGNTGDTTDQDATSGTLSFTDADLTDRHTAAASLSSASWSGGSTIPNETLAALAGAMNAAVAADSTGSGSGTVEWNFSAPDQTFDFLAAGETLSATYDVSVTDAQGATSTQPVTVNITGTDDAPTIVPDSTTAAGAITELPDTTGSATMDTTSGKIAFTDVDLTDQPTAEVTGQIISAVAADGTTPITLTSAQIATLEGAFSIAPEAGNANNGAIDWTYSVQDSNLDFLDAGETVSLTSAVQIDDGHGGQASQPVAVTIIGSSEPNTVLGTPGDDYLNIPVAPGQIPAADALAGYDWMDLTGTAAGQVNIDLTAPDQLVSIAGVPEPLVQQNFEAVDASQMSGGPVNVVGGTGAQVIGTNLNDTITINGDYGNAKGGDGDDTITMNGYGEKVSGGAGNDDISVTGNHFDIDAGDGNNTLMLNGSGFVHGGAGSDTMNLVGDGSYIDCDGGGDIVNLEGNGNYLWGNFNADHTPVANPGNEQITVTGMDNKVYAGDGNNTITINATYPYAESNNNHLEVGNGNNNVSLNGYNTMAFLGNGNNQVTLNGNSMQVTAGSGTNVFDVSGNPSDYGNVLWGGTGSDTFIFHAGFANGDVINDFTPSVDHLQLQGFTGSITQTVGANYVRFQFGSESIILSGLTAPLTSQDYTLT